MGWLSTFLQYTLSPWVQIAILAAIVGVPIYLLAAMLFGRDVANRYIIHGLAALVTLGYASHLRQEGYKRRLEEEERANKVAEDVAEEERRKSKNMPDVDLNKEVDKWPKH